MSTDFYVTLPSTAGGQEFGENTPNHFKVRLPHPLRFPGRGWKVGLSSISLPDARVNLYDLVPEDQYLIQANWSVQRGQTIVVGDASVLMADIDDLDSVVDGETLMRACIDLVEAKRIGEAQSGDQFKTGNDQHRHVKFEWVSHGRDQDLLLKNDNVAMQGTTTYAKFYISRNFALKMGWLLENNELGPNLRQEFIGGDVPDIQKNPHLKDLVYLRDKNKFVYWKVIYGVLQLSMACNWRFIHLNKAFGAVVGSPNRTLHVYSDVGGSGIVGNQVTDLLREIQYVRRGRGTSYFEPLHVQHIPLRNEVIEVVETQISETEGQLVRFGTGQAIVTLHFKREV